MSKKFYILLAVVIGKFFRSIQPDERRRAMFLRDICSILSDDNPRFDRERFLAAIKTHEEKKDEE